MPERIRARLTYANVVSTLCLFLLLGGGAYAATKLKRDSVGSKQLKSQAVRTADLGDNAVTSPKVKNGSLLSEDFAVGQIPAGPQGEQGSQGLPGADGAPGPTAAAAKGSGGDPAITPDLLLTTAPTSTISAPTSGRVLAMFTTSGSNMFIDCSSGGAEFGLYIDGVAVPETKRVLPDNVGTPVDVFGVSAPITSGAHKIEVGANCPTGNVASVSFNDTSIGGLLLGS